MKTKKKNSAKRAKKIKKPWFKKPSREVSERMKQVKSFGTRLEHTMEDLLKEQKIRYERQPKLLGRPDFRIKGTNVLVFCDSSFWHGRREKEIKGEAFKKNKEFWMNKLRENRRRDTRVNRVLRKEGWCILRFLDTDILKFPEKVTKKLLREIKKNEH